MLILTLEVATGDFGVKDRNKMVSTCQYGLHKGFYNEDDITAALCNISYSDFFEASDDDEFPFDAAEPLLRGSCHHFALSLQKVLGYNPYIIQGNNKTSFHVFCQIYKGCTWYYIDARGITTSFDEFMSVAREFVSDEYTIRPVTPDDIEEWEKDSDYKEEAYAFSEAVIEKYKECYTL